MLIVLHPHLRGALKYSEKHSWVSMQSKGSVNRIQEFISVMYPDLKVQNLAAKNENYLLSLTVIGLLISPS